MRVITGQVKGKRLVTPDGNNVRPTPERVKEAIFSALQFDIEGRRVLDLFAGSGQLAIEALSRGAASAVLVDSSASSVRIARKNIELCEFTNKARVVQADYAAFCASSKETFDIVFLDPPYNAGLLNPAIKSVLPLLSDYATIVCEHPPEVELAQNIGGFAISRTYRYGKVLLTVYRKEEPQ